MIKRNFIPALALACCMFLNPAFGQSQADLEKQIRDQLSSVTPPETVFDNITFSLSGSEVTLSGFTTLPARSKDSERAVRSLPWVETVVNEIVVTSVTGSDEQIRSEAVSILINQIPRAFPQPWPRLRIKVNYGQVELHGVIEPNEEYRLRAAVKQIEARPFVTSVQNHVTVR